jgi:hypothetical protein
MRTLIAILCASAVSALSVAQAEDRATAPAPTTPSAIAAPKLDPTVVPRGRLYALLDDSGRKIRDFQSGQQTPMTTTDCVQVPCPDTFDKNVVCWKCKERIKAN